MYKLIMMFVLLISMKQSSSQPTTYPRSILINNKDTVIVYKPWQVRYINDVYVVGFAEVSALNAHYKAVIDSSASVIDKQGKVINDLREELRLTGNIVADLKGEDANSQKQIQQLERKGKLSAFERDIVGVAAVYLAVRLFVK